MTQHQEDIVLLRHILSSINDIYQHSGGILENLHDYLGDIDPIIVYKVIKEQLPDLEIKCKEILKELKEK